MHFSEAILETLKEAVINKTIIKFYYEDSNGKFKDYRTVDPYLIGTLKVSNELTLKAWFVPSVKQKHAGHKEGWKLYSIHKIQSLEITKFQYKSTKIRYNPKDTEMSDIICSTAVVN